MPDSTGALDAWERHLCAPVTGRKVICAFEVLAGLTQVVSKLRRWGARRPLLLADGVGTGPLPAPDEADVELLEPVPFDTVTEQVRARTRPLSRLSPEVVEAVERYDPDRGARWWMSPVTPNEPLLGRSVLSGRPATAAALENKVLVDDLLDAIAAPGPPSRTCGAGYHELTAATDDVLARSGATEAVWAGDNRDGVNGGGDYVRWIRTPDHARAAAEFFAAHCDRVRVSPYLQGVPCSIHGIVLPDGVVVLRPVELISLLRPLDGRFTYAGLGTTWDPAGSERDEMRSLARELGTYLRRTYGYRGAFGVDGVVTSEGYRVTEVNTRFSGGLTRLAAVAPQAQLELVHVNALIGRDVGRAAGDIEERALDLLDATRFVDVVGLSSSPAGATTMVRVRTEGARLEAADVGDDAVATVQRGPAANGTGSFVRLRMDDDTVARGERCAPYGALLYEFADRTWATGFGHVTPPSEAETRSRG
jgi:ATP-grasp domain-containing protein